MANLLDKFRVVKHVTLPLLKLTDNKAYFIQVKSAFKLAEQVKNPKKDEAGNPVRPPFIFQVVDLESGEDAQMIANDVFKTELERQYKDESYIGKYFEIVKITKADGKRYNTFNITELAPVEETKPEAAAPAPEAPTAPAPEAPTAPAPEAPTAGKGGKK